MTVRICKRCGEPFNDKKNDNAWDLAALLTLGWAGIAEPDDRDYCSDCVKD